MKLLKEINEVITVLTEETGDVKSLYIQGPFMQAEVTNRNRRMYPINTLQREVNRYIKEYVEQDRAVGELGHPDKPTINPDRISHKIISLRQEGNDFIGKAKILNTPMGQIAAQLAAENVKLGVSSRGVGSLKEASGFSIVQDDFMLATPADIVMDPSAPKAFVQSMMEDREWVFSNGFWTEKKHEIAKKTIRRVSKKQLEQTGIDIFNKYLNSVR